ncbi:MAG: hypothetical protein ACOVNR_10280, partial [Chitinophagaceae bacterium]
LFMMQLIADSGATKCEWCYINNGKHTIVLTQGISPYFLSVSEITAILQKELVQHLPENEFIGQIHFYGTGLTNQQNVAVMQQVLCTVFPQAQLFIENDLLAAARSLCGRQPGIACILGTGANSCYYDGEKIIKNSPGLGYILGDEGSGAYMGKKVVQYYLYETFDEQLHHAFNDSFKTDKATILQKVYKEPLANRYLAKFAYFLAENRGHYMIENIIEDSLNEFFFIHLCKYQQSWLLPIHFTGSIAFGFKDVLTDLCHSYEFEMGTVTQKPMNGLISYHTTL